ncbi:enoyl-CoA hydratase/isomerase family protein [Denitratisoma oestradiolicum]|uniref:Crotonase n=1 Tax=Denitratisoma oestradiolicum TaxID=311182 RepID=A0A6S6XUU4_9PROT|nr:enoyl-CoA hydratase/isomerase family protein [Denitratisoma oestradiolicum]TWO81224.1 hypothetical protein CBW56_06395 [Denitratisoma oestradiolicum]CAB1367923.1 Crotonase [Denitratisoma oestradiolicum]
MNEFLSYEKQEGVATITKTSTEHNQGMTRGVLVGLKRALEGARDDDEVRVVVITAAGNGIHDGARVFPELRQDVSFTPMEFREILQFGHALMRQIETLEKPVIGVAKGGALGGGLEMLHACDFVITADTATFSQPEVAVGLMCGWGGTQRLPRLMGWRRAKELLLCGSEITGKEAAELGLVTRAVPLDQVDAEVATLIGRLKAASPLAQAYTKLAMNKVWETNLGAGLDYEVDAETVLAAHQEFPAFMKSLYAGEAPSFTQLKRLTGGSDWK